jgi:DNA-binding response OmpR family regulator
MDKVAGFELGADDYITKPFDLQVLLKRIRKVFR